MPCLLNGNVSITFFHYVPYGSKEWRRSKKGGERGGERDNYQVAFYPKLYFTQAQNNSYHSKLTHPD